MQAIITEINAWAWGVPMQVLLLGTGVFLTAGLGFLTWIRLGLAFRMLASGRSGRGEGDIPPFRALMTSLSATIGTGNIAGVATAMTLGGPGALFWMWLTALFGMAMKYAEAVLAVRFREQDDQGGYSGGPMYYIKNGLGPRFAILGSAFALFGSMAGFGLANTVQSNSVAQVLADQFQIPWLLTGALLMLLVGAVILGGIKRIAATASAIVPTMAVAYIAMSSVVLILHWEMIPSALSTIVSTAFTGASAAGGFAGATVWAAIRFGVARGIFSNEAGLGSAPIAHAAAQTNEPVEQGLIAMLGTFIDTLVVCTMTGLVIMLTGVLESGISGASLTAMAFGSAIPGGELVVTLGVVLFATTTMIGWSFYGERCVVYLFGTRAILPFRVLWVLAIPIGAGTDLGLIWLIADTLNAFMAIPNLIALLLLSPVVFALSRDYFFARSRTDQSVV
ncbi:MAG: sodium:alanine symporter family protein [Luminiphilus sp.]|nr:sodium:alanine symporter family protein [Luminiphilus sp.]